MRAEWFACACSALMAAFGFAHRAVRLASAESGGAIDIGFLGLVLVLYGVAVLWGARRIVTMGPEQAQAELLRVAAVGFVLAALALEMV